MKVTYIHHSAVSVETEHSILLFDYFKGELPDFDPGKPLFVFASHFHEDHYSPVIFERFREREGVSYILSDDIKGRRIPKEALPLIHFVKPGQTLELGEVKIQTYKSTDEGCAFWVSLEGLEPQYGRQLQAGGGKNRRRPPGGSGRGFYPPGSQTGTVVLSGNGRLP